MIGAVVANYVLERKLGSGGMGEVYLAQHQNIARRAAIKVLLPQLSANPELVERFFTEARATSVIRHRGIVEVLDCGTQDGRAYIAMEYLEGESLARCLERLGSFAGELPTAYTIARQIAQAVGAAHARGIAHRDLKPDNIFLAATDDPAEPLRVKILDFGIAKLFGDSETNSGGITRTGSLLGTPLYMSPEQCRGAGVVDHRTDIYSLGCILYEMVAGRPPFVRSAPGDLVVAHLTEPVVPASTFEPALPKQLDDLLLRMLAKDPGERVPSMAAVEDALRPFDGSSRALRETLVLPPAPVPAPPVQRAVQVATRLLPPEPPAGPLPTPKSTTFSTSAGEVVAPPPKPTRRLSAGWWVLGGVLVGAVPVILFLRASAPSLVDPAPAAATRAAPAANETPPPAVKEKLPPVTNPPATANSAPEPPPSTRRAGESPETSTRESKDRRRPSTRAKVRQEKRKTRDVPTREPLLDL